MKRLVISVILLAVLSACESEREKFLKEERLIGKAEVYANQVHETYYRRPPVLVVYNIEGEIIEALDLSYVRGMIGHETYETTPFRQLLGIVREDNDIGYVEAVRKVEGERQNYFAEDCPNIKQALLQIKLMDLTYHHKIPFSRNPDNASYSYLYIDRDNGSVSHRINSGIAEHPVSEIYRIAKKAIKECPYPTEPPKL